MKIALRTDGPVRGWHERLRDRLAADGHALAIHCTGVQGLPAGLDMMLAMERRLYRSQSMLFADTHANGVDESHADLVLDVRFDGMTGERALVDALLARHAPRVEVVDAGGHVLAAGLPALEQPDVLARSLDHVLARTVQLVAAAVRAAPRPRWAAPISDSLPRRAAHLAPTFLVRTLAYKLRGKLGKTDARPPPWRIAVRTAEAPGVAAARDWRGAAFVPLANDGQRFEADPFVVEHAGRTCLFYEDFPFTTRKGVIAMRELKCENVWSAPRVVLEAPYHLSYPHIFVYDREVYMLPEMSAAGRLQLFRADPFPERFVPDRVLLEGLEVNDATLVAHDGGWWLFATLSGDRGSTWDALGLFSAPHPFGPWTPHPENPVLIDSGAARPAGAMWHEGTSLMRIAQDCRAGYGGGLAIARVDRLDGAGYVQTIVARLAPPAHHQAWGVHTLNRAGGFEVIDLV